ncbi:MAG: ribosome recycling factor, partial [Clostridiales bacterium]|nr:ribosome recycling factor [Clostridiales bacterium]
ANIGINPANDGKVIRLAIPQLTEERRKELTKVVKNYGEDAKVAVRNLRRDVNDELKKAEKAGELTEDDLKDELEETQKTVEKAIKDIDAIIAEKEKELMEV